MGTCITCGRKNIGTWKKMCYTCRMEEVPVTSVREVIKDILNVGKKKKK